jgi:hypothetical protein
MIEQILEEREIKDWADPGRERYAVLEERDRGDRGLGRS